MEFTNKEVRRAIRDFNSKVEQLAAANHHVYGTRVREFIHEIENNQVLKTIINPYMEMEVNFNAIEGQHAGDWFNFNLPSDTDEQIAYVLQIMKRSSIGEFPIENYAFHIFRQKKLNDNISSWNSQILIPVLDKLHLKLEDLLEDEVEGKDQIPEAKLQIINNGTITAQQGNVAIGKEITQKINQDNISNEIVEKALQDQVISKEQAPQLKEITDKIENELNKENPSQVSLEKLISRLYDLGEKALIKITTDLVNFPIWTNAVNDFLLQL